MGDLTPEQMLERVRACIAEAGYDPSAASLRTGGVSVTLNDGVPDFTAWRALVLAHAGVGCACWPCWRDDIGVECSHPVDPFVSEDAEATA